MMSDYVNIVTQWKRDNCGERFLVAFYDSEEGTKIGVLNFIQGQEFDDSEWKWEKYNCDNSWLFENRQTKSLWLDFDEKKTDIDYKKEKARKLWVGLQELGFKVLAARKNRLKKIKRVVV
jgi:hypothetical protein